MLSYECLPFDKLNLDQLYRMLQLRQEVFIVEQDCPYLDADDKDLDSFHVLGYDEYGKLQAYTRLIPKGTSYKGYTSIGRVITSSAIRGKNQGKLLMQYSIDKCLEIWPHESIKISAQTYIVKFYNDLGFLAVGDEYLEDNIPHVAMIRKSN